MYWVVVMTALTRFAKKVGLSCSLLFSIGHCANREHPVMLVTCQPPIGWAIGTMTAWTLGLSCRSLFACVTSSCDLFAPWVASACAVARDWPCDCSVACGPLCPNSEQFMIGSSRGSEVDKSFTVFISGLGFVVGCTIGIVVMEACLFCGVEVVAKKVLGILELGFEVGPSLFCGRVIVPLLVFFEV